MFVGGFVVVVGGVVVLVSVLFVCCWFGGFHCCTAGSLLIVNIIEKENLRKQNKSYVGVFVFLLSVGFLEEAVCGKQGRQTWNLCGILPPVSEDL